MIFDVAIYSWNDTEFKKKFEWHYLSYDKFIGYTYIFWSEFE